MHIRPISVAAFAAALACHSGSTKPGSDAGPAPSASASGSSAALPSASHRPPPGQLCRAISVKGQVKLSGILEAPLDAGTLLEGAEIPDAWIELDQGAFTAKHEHTARETTFTGPAKFRPCVVPMEEAWIARGKFESSVGAEGQRPGGEEWVVTPYGVLRYGAAAVHVIVTAGKLDVKLSSGTAYLWSADKVGAITPKPVATDAGGIPDGWTRLDGARSVAVTEEKTESAEAGVKRSVETCATNAKATKDLATAINSPDAAVALGPKQVMSRRVAHAACAIAGLRVDDLPPSPQRDEMQATIKQAETDWRTSRPHGFRGRRPMANP